MTKKLTFGQRVKLAREHGGFTSKSALARRVSEIRGRKTSPQAIEYLEAPKNKANSSELTPAIARATGVRVDWLADNHGEMVEPSRVVQHANDVGPVNADYVTVERYVPAVGWVRQQAIKETVRTMSLSRGWLRTHVPRISGQHNLKLICVYGDSMAPTFNDGDILFVDLGVTELEGDGIFLVRANETQHIKRVTKRVRDGSYIVSNDNPVAGEREEFAAARPPAVVGKVVGAWNWRIL